MRSEAAETDDTQVRQTAPPVDESRVIPVIEEQVTFDKQVVETGKVRISKRVIEHEELVDLPMFREEISVERVPINQYLETPPQVRQEGDIMIIPVVQEQIFYQKRLLLVEELRVTKKLVEEHNPQQITLLKEEVEVTRLTPDEIRAGAANNQREDLQ